MDRTVALLNIEHFRKRLAVETDEAKQRTLRQLLAEEVAKLVSITEQPNQKNALWAFYPTVDPRPGVRVDPTGQHAPAREDEGVWSTRVDDGQSRSQSNGAVDVGCHTKEV